jgi:predicted dehydrogenase
MPTRLRVGIIGLGRRWRQYLPALTGLRRNLEVIGVCDQVADAAERTARRLGCVPAAGVVDLLERDDVNAVVLLDRQWYGLWPLQLACRVGKPAFCGPSLVREAQPDALHQQVQASGLPVMMGNPSTVAPAVQRLRHLLSNHLGPVRLLRIDRGLRVPPDPAGTGAADLLGQGAVLGMLQVCAILFDGPPISIWTVAVRGSSLVTITLEFGPDQLAQLNLWADPLGPPTYRLHAVAQGGRATALLPRRLVWRDPDTQHRQQWPRHPLRQTLLQRFALTVKAGQKVQPSFEEAYQALLWLRAARHSQREGRRVLLTTAPQPSP